MTVINGVHGWYDEADIARISELAKLVPPNGVIVEIGSLLGQSSYALAKNCHPSVTVFAIDVWDPKFMPNEMMKDFGTLLLKEVFRDNTKDCANLIPLQGYSPQDISDWNLPIDMYFNDGVHNNPGFLRNEEFWTIHLKPGGILCGHDFSPIFPDIVDYVRAQEKTWQQTPRIECLVWSFNKPQALGPARHLESTTARTVLDKVEDGEALSGYLKRRSIHSPIVAVVHDVRTALPNEVRRNLAAINCNDYILLPPETLSGNMSGDLYGIKADTSSQAYPLPHELDVIIVTSELSEEAQFGLQQYLWPRLKSESGIVYLHQAATPQLLAHEMACLWMAPDAVTESGSFMFRLDRPIPKLVCRVNTVSDLTSVQKKMIIERLMEKLPAHMRNDGFKNVA